MFEYFTLHLLNGNSNFEKRINMTGSGFQSWIHNAIATMYKITCVNENQSYNFQIRFNYPLNNFMVTSTCKNNFSVMWMLSEYCY